jgi:hypothetical protein
MEGKRVSISGASGRRTGHAAIPDDLRDEIFRSQIHIDGERLDTYPSLMGHCTVAGCRARRRGNDLRHRRLAGIVSKGHIKARNLRESLEGMKARWEAAEGKVVEYRGHIQDMKVHLDAMSGAKCAIAEHKAVQELRAMQKKLDAQYSAMVGQDRILLEMKTRKSELEDQVRRKMRASRNVSAR